MISLCELGDKLILEETSTVFTKKVEGKAVEKGVAFPTCICINTVICNFSPIKSDSESQTELKDGDVVKVYVAAGMVGCALPRS